MASVKLFGDSHSIYFNLSPQVKNSLGYSFRRLNVKTNMIKGATIKGLGKRKSSLEAKKKITDFVHSDFFDSLNDYLVLAFGQVDIELGYYYERYVKKSNMKYVEFLEYIIESYREFVESLPIDRTHIVIKGVNLPALICFDKKAINYTSRIILENSSNIEEFKTIKLEMLKDFPSDFQRTHMHLRFNKYLSSMCSELGVKYFDINNELSGEDGLLKCEYVPSKLDHHLVDSLRVRKIHFYALMKTIGGDDSYL